MTEQRRARFWLISMAAHAAVAGIVLLSPVGTIVFEQEQPERPEVVRDGEELAAVIDDIRDLTVERLRAQNALLASAQSRMAQNFQTLNAHYQPFAAAQAATAQARFQQEADQTLHHQAELLAAAVSAAADPEAGMDGLIAALEAHQARIITGQEEIKRSLHLLAPERADLLERQKALEEQQLKAFQFLGWSRDTHGSIGRDRKRQPELEQQITTLEGELRTLASAIAEHEAARDAAKAAHAEAKEQDAKRAARDAENAANRALRDAQREQSGKQRALDKAREDLAKIQERLPEHIKNRNTNVGIGRNLHQGASDEQRALVEALSAALAADDATGAAP